MALGHGHPRNCFHCGLRFLQSKQLVTWSADVDTNDWWRGSSPGAIAQRAMRRLNAQGSGIILMHDIHRKTAMALPILLKELKVNGYNVVHVVAAGERPTSIPEPIVSSTSDWKASTANPTNARQRRSCFDHSTKPPHQETQRKQASSGALVLPKRPK
jgi:hypothetical protein